MVPSVSLAEEMLTFLSSANWTVPAGVTSIKLLLVGGGGGGAGSDGGGDNHAGGGGGSGGWVYYPSISVTPGSSYYIGIGAGGAPGIFTFNGINQCPLSTTSGSKNANSGGSTLMSIGGVNLAIVGGGGGGGGSTADNGSQSYSGAGGYPDGEAGGVINPNRNEYGQTPGGVLVRVDPTTGQLITIDYGRGGNSNGWVYDNGWTGTPNCPTPGWSGMVKIWYTPPPPNAVPVGYLDGADCSNITGWAYDPDVPSTPITVHLYRGGSFGSGTFVGAYTTDTYRSDVNAAYNITGNHGYTIPVDSSFKTGTDQSIYVYALDSAGGTNPLLTNSPKTINCTSVSVPTVTTSAVTSIGQTSATSGGTISSNGGATVTVSGIAWGTSANPTTSNSKTTNGWATSGPWSSSMTGLSAGTTYHVRAYATNSAGTAYGSDVSFTTAAAPDDEPLSGCSATTISNCSLSSTSSGNSSGSCATGYTGSCVYSCSNGTWSLSSNSCAIPATPQPDLTAGSISPTSATPGTATTFSATISNNGTASTGAGFTDLFQRAADASGTGATDIGTASTATLAVGNTTASLSYTFSSAGTYYVRACADKSSMGDVNGVISESNEDNNCGAWTAITVSAEPAEPAGACSPVMRTSGSSWTIPAGMTSVKVWAIGAGGGGAGSIDDDGSSGGGGGAGATTYKTYAVTAGQSLSYSLGSAGTGGYGAANGEAGGNTTATYGGATITAVGGSGGWYNNGSLGSAGWGSGGDGAATGGTGSGAGGDTGGGGGGGIGGGIPVEGGSGGDTGGQSIDVSGLFSALSALGISTTAPGAGGTAGSSNPDNMNGTSATGFGSGGGGAGYYGGNGGAGIYGGGGGGAAGYTGSTRTGGAGGAGVVVINPVGCNSVPETPTATLTATPTTINSGQSSTLTWSSTNATSCTAAGGFSTGNAASNSTGVSVSPSTTSTYSITCTGTGGTSAPATATVTVAVPTLSISASPNRAKSGGSSTIAWSASDVGSCSIKRNGTVWRTTTSGSASDTITRKTTYILSCNDVNGVVLPQTAQAVVNLVPGFLEF